MANKEVIELVEETEKINPTAAYIVNISYFPNLEEYRMENKPAKKGGKKTRKEEVLMDNFILDIPPKIFELRNKNRDAYHDIVETFVYNTISKKVGREVAHCQIYLADM